MSDDRAAVYREGDKTIYRASAVGYCPEALLGLRQGIDPAPPPEWFQEKLDEGTASEAAITEMVLKEYPHAEMISTQDEVEVEITPNLVIRGHTDGRVKFTYPAEIGMEVKKLGPSLWKNWRRGIKAFWDAHPYYRDQLTIYMHGTGLEFLYGVGEWDVDKGEVVGVSTAWVTLPPGDINQIKAKIVAVEARALAGEMPECDGKGMWPCPVHFLHGESEVARVDNDELEDELLEAASEYLWAKRKEAADKEMKDAAHARLLKLMENQPESVIVGEAVVAGGYLLTKYDHVSSRQDKEALERDGIDLSKYRIRSTTPRVKVTAKE